MLSSTIRNADQSIPTLERVTAVDTVRGFALLGVLLINLRTFSGIGSRNPILTVLLEGKSVAIFSMLFGAGLALLWDKREGGAGSVAFLLRRQLALLMFGCAHALLLWNGDILVLYAVAGMLVVPFLALRQRWLLAAAGFLMALDAALVCHLLQLPAWMDPDRLAAAGKVWRQAADAATAHGTWRAALSARAHEWAGFWLPVQAGMLFWSISLFLVGGWIWRSGVFLDPDRHRKRLATLAWVGIPFGVAVNLVLVFWGRLGLPMQGAGWTGFLVVVYLSATVMGAGYAAAILWLRLHPTWRRWLDGIAPLGRMGFTTYLTQSIVCTVVFAGWGLGRWGTWGWGRIALFGGALYLVQAWAANWWLQRFHFGPAEWAWRCLTYGRLHPFLKRPNP